MANRYKSLADSAYFKLPENLAFLQILAERGVTDCVQFTGRFVAFREKAPGLHLPPTVRLRARIPSFYSNHFFVTRQLSGNLTACRSPFYPLFNAFIDHAMREPERWIGLPVAARQQSVAAPA